MRIDDIPKCIAAKAIPFTVFTGTKYCFCYSDGITGSVSDPYSPYVDYDWENRLSVLFSEKELLAFRPDDTVFNFKKSLIDGIDTEITNLKKAKRYSPSAWIEPRSKKVINIKQRIQDKIDFLKDNTIVFLKITFEK